MGFPKGGEHPLCEIEISAGVDTPAAKRLRLIDRLEKDEEE